jgi:hypothetical protein
MDQFVHVCVIQVGCNDGFTPNVDFAHIPNQEFLNLLCDSVCGTFLYASDLPYISDEPFNFYHQMFIVRSLDGPQNDFRKKRPVDYVRLANANIESSDAISKEELSFPWVKNSIPPVIAMIMCQHREYKLDGSTLHDIIHSRLKDGFSMTDINIKKKSKSPNERKIELTFELVWLTDVKIVNNLHFSIVGKGSLSGTELCSKLKVNLSINSHFNFALIFVNIHDYDGHDRLNSLYVFLREIYDSDVTLQLLADFRAIEWIKIKGHRKLTFRI